MIPVPDHVILSGSMRRTLLHLLQYLHQREEIGAVYLFGSRCRGPVRPYSDLDLCIISRDHLSREEKEDIGSFSAPDIDISFFDDLPSALQFRVLRDGVPVLVRDDLALHRAVVGALREYHEFRHVIDRSCARVVRGSG